VAETQWKEHSVTEPTLSTMFNPTVYGWGGKGNRVYVCRK